MQTSLPSLFTVCLALWRSRIANVFYPIFSTIKTTIGKPHSEKVNLSYGLSFTRQMPMRYPTGFV